MISIFVLIITATDLLIKKKDGKKCIIWPSCTIGDKIFLEFQKEILAFQI